MKKAITVFAALLMVLSLYASGASALESGYTYSPSLLGQYVLGIPADSTVSAVKDVFPNQVVDIYTWNDDGDTPALDGSRVCTGDRIRLNGTNYTLVVIGDINGDGIIDGIDSSLVKSYALGRTDLADIDGLDSVARMVAAGDTDRDGKITATEYVKVRRSMAGTYDLLEKFITPIVQEEDDWGSKWV